MSPKRDGNCFAGNTRAPPMIGPTTAPNPQNIGINENALLWFEESDNSPKIVVIMLELALNVPAKSCDTIALLSTPYTQGTHTQA
jgi:hypothetical protein